MKRNLIYHIWPSVISSSQWRYNIDKLSEYIQVFNNKIIVAIAVEKTSLTKYQTEPVSVVMDWFLSPETMMGKKVLEYDLDIEFFSVDNYGHLRECTSFYKLLRKVESLDENEITFYAHAKGQRWQRNRVRKAEMIWISFMMRQNLEDICLVENILSEYSCMGSIVAFEDTAVKTIHKSGVGVGFGLKGWFYDGTFFWFNNKKLFSRESCYDKSLMTVWWGVEWYLCSQFLFEEAYDNVKEEYQEILYHWKHNNSGNGHGASYNIGMWKKLLEEYPEAIT